MQPLSVEDYKELAWFVNSYKPGDPPYDFGDTYKRVYDFDAEEVVAKERPRRGKGGQIYTPAATRNFERMLKQWAIRQQIKPVPYPVSIKLVIRDQTDEPNKRLMSLAGLDFDLKRDIDNLTKAVLDGLNGVLYRDDKQVVDLHARRRFGARPGFNLEVNRRGLSKQEMLNLLKFL